ncbi:hypothetical protein ES702_02949 [subsurface metagenome]
MTKEDLIDICNDQISVLGKSANISLIMPGKWGKTNKRRLCPGGPTGNIVSDNFTGPGIIVLFNAIEVKQFFSNQ